MQRNDPAREKKVKKTSNQRILAAAICTLLLFSGCFRNDIRTESFVIETMRTPDDLRSILIALQQLDGIVAQPEADLVNGVLTVQFDGRATALKNIEHAIAEAGHALPHRPLIP